MPYFDVDFLRGVRHRCFQGKREGKAKEKRERVEFQPTRTKKNKRGESEGE